MARQFLDLLDRWNRTHALTALPAKLRMEELVQDSAALFPHLEDLPPGSRLLDMGTGMGVPAILLAMGRPDLQVLALDKSMKKLAFVRQAALELGLRNLEPLRGLAQEFPPLACDAGVSKATASLELLTAWWQRHGQPGAPLFALKGPLWEREGRPEGWRLDVHPYELPTRGARVVLELRQGAAGA